MTMRRLKVCRAVVTAAMVAVLNAGVSAQCAMCRTVLASPEGQRWAAALRHGIVILLAAPIGAFAVIGYAALRSQRRIDAMRVPPVPVPSEEPSTGHPEL